MLFLCTVSQFIHFLYDERLIAVKVYTPPNAALRGCHVYDMENGGARHVLQGPYDSIRGFAAAK